MSGAIARAEELLKTLGDGTMYGTSVAFAIFHLINAQLDQAFDWIDKSVDERHPLVFMTLVNGLFAATLRTSPRWPALNLARRLNLPQAPAM